MKSNNVMYKIRNRVDEEIKQTELEITRIEQNEKDDRIRRNKIHALWMKISGLSLSFVFTQNELLSHEIDILQKEVDSPDFGSK